MKYWNKSEDIRFLVRGLGVTNEVASKMVDIAWEAYHKEQRKIQALRDLKAAVARVAKEGISSTEVEKAVREEYWKF